MIIISSLSPNHSNNDQQVRAIKSWTEHCKCFSMNCQQEINELIKDGKYGTVRFIPTERTIDYFVGKPLVSINAMLDVARNRGSDLLITNSDIIIENLPFLKQDGVTAFSRYDYIDSKKDAKLFVHGFDVFYIPRHLLKIFPPSIHGMGSAWWDYWIPFHCILKNIPVYYPSGIYAYHKLHSTQYPLDEWFHIGEHFRWEFKLSKHLSIEQIAQTSLLAINNYLTR